MSLTTPPVNVIALCWIQPAQNYPNIFPADSLWGRFPYLLPCVVISAFAIPVLVLSVLLPMRPVIPGTSDYLGALETLHKHPLMEEENPDLNPADIDIEKEEPQNEKTYVKEKQEEKMTTLKTTINNWPVMSTIIIICVYCLHDIAYSEIFSLWAVSPRREGGLGFTTSQVGVVLAISGFGLLVFQITTFAPLAKLFGPIHVTRTSAIISLPLLTAYPFIAMLRDQTLWIVINCASLLKNILSVMTITGTFLLLNNASAQNERATANGLQMSAMSFFKAIGPAAAGILFSWGQKRQNANFLPGFHLVCFVLNIVVIIFIIMTFEPILPHSTNKSLPKDESDFVLERQEQVEE